MTDQAVLDALAEYTLELDGTEPASDAPLEWAGESLATAEIVGLGEATHGTREFVQLKHRLLRHLVSETGLRALCLEAGFGEALALDRYVTDGEGTAGEALASLRGWSWASTEMRALVNWIREFNADRPREDRVRIYGLDAQYTADAVDALQRFLQRVDLQYVDTIRAELHRVDDGGRLLGRGDDHDRRVAAGGDLVSTLRERFAANEEAYVAGSSREQFRQAQHCLAHIEGAVAFKEAVRSLRRGSNDDEAATRCLRRRDRAMADTVEWVREEHPRIALWAHNAHVNRSGQRARGGQVRAPSLGSRLADRYGEGYLAVGFAFGSGQFRAITEIVEPEEPRHVRRLECHSRPGPDPGSIEDTLASLAVPVGLVDLRGAREDDRLADWLRDPRHQFSAGVTYGGESPAPTDRAYVHGEAFDVLCYVDETTPTRAL